MFFILNYGKIVVDTGFSKNRNMNTNDFSEEEVVAFEFPIVNQKTNVKCAYLRVKNVSTQTVPLPIA